jgi:hypothetical protein
MSLINLLTVGATLKGRGKSGGYNLASIASMPTFNAGKPADLAPGARGGAIADAALRLSGSPLEPAAAAAPQPGQTVRAEEVPGTQLRAGQSPTFQGVGSEGTTGLPAINLSRTNATSPKEPRTPAESEPAGGSPLDQFKSLMAKLWGRPQLPPRPTQAVQTELALENVTVVRNDLSDEAWPGESHSRSVSDPTDTVGSWINLTACFGKKAARKPEPPPPVANKPEETQFIEGPDRGLIARI